MPACMSTWRATTSRSRPRAPTSAVGREICMEPHLFQAHRLILWADLARSPIRSPTSSGEKPPESVVFCVHPAAGTAISIGTQRIRARVQQPRAVAPMLGGRIHHELIDRAVHAWVRIVILARHGGGESHYALTVGRDQNPKRRLRRSLNCRTPRVGHLRQ
jgi:hypothetical protein